LTISSTSSIEELDNDVIKTSCYITYAYLKFIIVIYLPQSL
jgi:hypothetical protein